MSPPSPEDPARDLIGFIDASPTPYHAVREVAGRLRSAGFRELDEREAWKISAGDRVFVVRQGGSIIALVAGNEPPSEAGFLLIGAHTDSPNFRLKPVIDSKSKGYRQIGAEVYGAVLLHTWLDRDLSVAGRVSLIGGASYLVRLDEPIGRIANLAIHLNPNVNTNGLVLNEQQHLRPTIGLVRDGGSGVVELVSRALEAEGVKDPDGGKLAGFDLCLYDVQGGAVGGSEGEFLYSARLDNLASCHAAVRALLASGPPGAPTRGIVLHDHEEIGSQSASGAKGVFLSTVLERVATAYPPGGEDAAARARARSLLISADMAHAVHPNYSEKHDPDHMPRLGRGPVIKINASQSYATDAPGAAVFEAACRECGFEAQRFVSRNDLRCGSTIGPISAAQTGIRTVDVGNPMLSMHSCREMAGTADVDKMIRALTVLLSAARVPPASM